MPLLSTSRVMPVRGRPPAPLRDRVCSIGVLSGFLIVYSVVTLVLIASNGTGKQPTSKSVIAEGSTHYPPSDSKPLLGGGRGGGGGGDLGKMAQSVGVMPSLGSGDPTVGHAFVDRGGGGGGGGGDQAETVASYDGSGLDNGGSLRSKKQEDEEPGGGYQGVMSNGPATARRGEGAGGGGAEDREPFNQEGLGVSPVQRCRPLKYAVPYGLCVFVFRL